jgi:hypothetical protein
MFLFQCYLISTTGNRAKTKKGNKKTQSVIYYLDFSETLRDCTGAESATADFEQWEPRGSFQSPCMLGHETKYTRRKRDVACLTGKAHMRKSFVRDCPCQEDDYECDIDYHRPHQKGGCIVDAGVEANKTLSILHQCSVPESKGLYYDPNGYRKVAGDTCIGGIAHVGTQLTCPAWAFQKKGIGWFKSIVYLMLVGVVGALFIMTERGRQTLSLVAIVCQNALNMLLGLCSKDSSQHGYAPVSRHDDYDDEVSFRKKSTPGRECPPRVCRVFFLCVLPPCVATMCCHHVLPPCVVPVCCPRVSISCFYVVPSAFPYSMLYAPCFCGSR